METNRGFSVWLKGITDRIDLKRKVAEDLDGLRRELEEEKDAILRACAQFGIFLKNNSVLTYNDAMIGYLNLLIKQAREKADQTQVWRRILQKKMLRT